MWVDASFQLRDFVEVANRKQSWNFTRLVAGCVAG